jgi:DNA-binding MarR family transcriptional regulator
MQDISVGAARFAATKIGDDVGLLLAKMHVAVSLQNNRALGDFGLRERSFWVLTLACSGLEPTQRELAIFLGLDPSQVVSLVDDLERRGLVERSTGKQDRRARIIVSTVEGRRIHRNARAALEACEHEQFTTLSEAEAGLLRMLLRKALWGSTDGVTARHAAP